MICKHCGLSLQYHYGVWFSQHIVVPESCRKRAGMQKHEPAYDSMTIAGRNSQCTQQANERSETTAPSETVVPERSQSQLDGQADKVG